MTGKSDIVRLVVKTCIEIDKYSKSAHVDEHGGSYDENSYID